MSHFRMTRSSSQLNTPPKPKPTTTKQETILKISGCTAYLVDEGEALELASGDFTIARVVTPDNKGGFPLATVIKVGGHLQWPLTRDEPVVRLDSRHYLFSLPMRRGGARPLSYGLTFPRHVSSKIAAVLDSFLAENSCFSGSSSPVSSSSGSSSSNLEWKQLAPRVEDYNNVLARGIAEGTGQIVRGIFMCSNVYSNLVHSCAEMILNGGGGGKGDQVSYGGAPPAGGMNSSKKSNGGAKSGGGPNQNSLKRVRDLSKMTEEVSKAMLDGANVASSSVMAPLLNSQAGKLLLASLPGEVIFASLDAINKILDAAEAAEKQALAATTATTTRVVSQRYGEGAAETTGDVLATAGHATNTAWNVVKFRRAVNPAKSAAASTAVLRNSSSWK
ncbi:unnamed protein product [Linum tenue]|uniref:Senescence domain-containing protein n=1 Tax=Linum tenue TaxID=586396 RepID=A0AAV0S8Y3_9ROSI|nr:unnamed protein product [Linum tenue]